MGIPSRLFGRLAVLLYSKRRELKEMDGKNSSWLIVTSATCNR